MFAEALDRLLIRLVKDNPELYDPDDPKYMDFNAREVVWQKIGDEMKRPATDCKLRWVNIRDVHRRIVRKCSVGAGSSKRYKYDKELSFMKPFYKDVAMNSAPDADNEEHNNEEDTIADDVDDQNKEAEAYYNDSDDSQTSHCKKKRKNKKSKVNKKKVKKERLENNVVETSCAFVDTSDTSGQLQLDPSDPVDSFLISIGSVLKNLSPYHLNLAKTKIFAVVQEHELQNIIEKEHHGNEPDGDAIYLSQ